MEKIKTIVTIIGGIVTLRLVVWAIFSGYYLAKDRENVWACFKIFKI